MSTVRLDDPRPARLDQIKTRWSLLNLAHQHSVTTAGPVRNALVLCYAKAIRSYVGALVKDEQDADEVAQEVLVRLLRGNFSQATPQRGRFRDLLRVAVRNMVRNYWSRKNRSAGVQIDVAEMADEATAAAIEGEEMATWRQSVLKLAWDRLEEYQRTHPGSVAFTVLRLRVEHADADSEELAASLSQKTGRLFRPEAMRQQLRRARMRFAEILLAEIARTLDEPSAADIEEELIALGLIDYVRDFLPAA